MKKERSTRLRWSWLRKIINIAFGLAVFSMAAKPVLAQETVLGPKDLKIGWFRIHFAFHKFTVDDPGEGTIIINKNTPGKKIRGGFARLNGKWIPLRHFLRGDDLALEKSVNLRSRNYLFVLLHGARGASISVEVKNKILNPPPEVNFSANPSAIKLGEASTLNWTTSYTTAVSIEPGIGSVDPSGSQTVTPTETTTYTLTAKGEGGSTTSKSATVTVYQPPTVTISADPETVIYGESSTLYWSSTNADKVVIDQNIGEVGYEGSLEVKPDRSATYTITASGPGGSAKAQAVLTVRADVKPQPDGSFGKQYEDLIPLDATLDVYDPKRFSVVTGLARDPSDLPLADVSVTILAHPEYGTVKTDSHGRFSIPVEGGGTNTVVYQKAGFITVQRKVDVPWNDISIAETIQMIAEDSASTTITFNGDPTIVTTHRSTEVVTEINGELKSRSCTTVFEGDNRAYEVDAQGTVINELDEITTRATEFPTPESMPAVLPPTSAFTYCAELSVDGVERVKFAQPLVMWVENFLGFAVGEVVPVGSYDRDRGVWVPEDNGVVVQLLDTDADGLVDAIDADGNSTPDDLDGDGLYSDEVRGLSDADSYPPGSTFWRAEVKHFSPVDANWPLVLPTGAIASNATRKSTVNQQKEAGRDCKNTRSSFVEERSGIFHEDIPIPGTDVTLHYASNSVGGYNTIITVPASGETVPDSLSRIIVNVEVAGRVFEQTFAGPPDTLTNKTAEFVWDGRDHLGREVSGLVRAKTSVNFVYPMIYGSGRSGTSAFGQPGQGSTTIPARVEGTVSKFDELLVQVRSSGGGTIAEGWSLSNHHWLSPTAPSTLYKGDGTLLKTVGLIIETVAGNGKWGLGGDGGPAIEAELPGPTSLKLDAAGNLYITAYFDNVIRKVDSKGIITTVAGTGQAGFNGDGISATTAKINGPRGTTVDSAGNLYFADYFNHRVRKVDSKGIITTIAGTGQSGFSGDGGPAIQAKLNLPTGVAVDPSGSIYVVDDHRVRKIDPKGIITTVAGNGRCTYTVTTGPALQASLCYPDNVEVDAAGNIYIADNGNSVIRKVDTGGIITTFAGKESCFLYSGNGVPATEACLNSVLGMYVDSSRNVYLADSWNNCIRKVDTNGIITTVAGICGYDQGGYSGDGGPALEARLDWPWDVEGDSSGNLYIADHNNAVVRKVGLSSAFLAILTDADIPSADPNGLGYIMSSAGHHKRTIDLDTGVVLYEFDYDDDGNLAAMIDRFGNESIVERNEAGLPTAIISPDGIRTTLSIDSNNHLTRISYPDGSSCGFEYTADGLMTAKIEPEGNRFGHVFDGSGRLINATDDEGGNWQYSRSTLDNGDTLTEVSTAEGEGTSYLDSTDLMGAYLSTITAPTGAQTLFSQSADGRSVTKSLACGMELHYEYDLDPEFKFQYVREMKERTPSGLEKVSVRAKIYRDNDGDDVPDVSTETVTVNGKTTILENNVPQARKTVTSPVGRTVTTDYDPQTLLTTRLAIPGLLDTTYGYNSRGRLTEIATGSRVTTFTYDSQGNVDSITDPENHTTTYTYDAVGRMTGINRPDGSSVGFSYDNNGNMTVLTNPANIAHNFGYNKVNLNSSYQTPASGSYSYVYDKDRRLTQVNFPSGKQIENIYANGTLEQIQTPEGNIDLTYLCGNKVDTITKRTEAITYVYDGSLVSAENLSGTLTDGLSYGYDDDFILTSFTYAGATISYSYDNDGLLTGAGSFAIGRNAANGLPESVTAGALNLSRTFNGYGEVGGQDFTVGGQGLTSWDLTRDNAGRITAKSESVDGVTSDYIYTYDSMGRLRTVTKDGSLVEEYQYGSVGTRIYEMNAPRGIAGRSMSYDDEDHLLTAGDAVYQYDADGYLTTRTVGTEPPYEVTSYVYSSRGELLRVTLSDGRVIEYVHDPLGRRIAKKVDGVITEKYLWQGLTRLLAVYDGTGNLLMRFLYADGRMPVAVERGTALYYLTYDQVGTLRVVADSSGNVVKRIDYDSFGNILADTNPTLDVPFGFAGGLHDRDTGLVRFGFRDYDPDTSRWTAKDPIGFAGGNIDLYGYCLNDPVNLIDILGLQLDASGKAIVAIGTGVVGLVAGFIPNPAFGAIAGVVVGGGLALVLGGDLTDVLNSAASGAITGVASGLFGQLVKAAGIRAVGHGIFGILTDFAVFGGDPLIPREKTAPCN